MKRKTVYVVLAVLAFAYIVLSLVLPPDPATLEKYHISALQTRLLVMTIVIPMIAIWWAAAYGYNNIKHYASVVKNSNEGQAFNTLANGLGLLALGLPLNQILNTVLTYYARQHQNFEATTKVINNYLSIAFALAAFILICRGAVQLNRTVRGTNAKYTYNLSMLFFIVLAAVYSFLVFTNDSRSDSTYYALSDFFILFTIVIPYLYIWYLGFMSSIRLHYYQHATKGLLYKKALSLLTLGFGGVIASSIFIQFLVTVSSGLQDLGLGALLALIYLFLLVLSGGYIIIALGSKRLAKIEEV